MIIIKGAGAVRRVDDLGRVVIPKYIRQDLEIKEGDAMKIFIDDDCVIFKKIKNQNKPLEV